MAGANRQSVAAEDPLFLKSMQAMLHAIMHACTLSRDLKIFV